MKAHWLDEIKRQLAEQTGEDVDGITLSLYDSRTDYKTEAELAQIILEHRVNALAREGGRPQLESPINSFLEVGLKRLLANLTDRIAWWTAQQKATSRDGTLGWQWFQNHIDSLEYVNSRQQELQLLPFQDRFREVATALGLGDRTPGWPGTNDWDETVEQDLFASYRRLEDLIATQEWGLDSCLPSRPGAGTA